MSKIIAYHLWSRLINHRRLSTPCNIRRLLSYYLKSTCTTFCPFLSVSRIYVRSLQLLFLQRFSSKNISLSQLVLWETFLGFRISTSSSNSTAFIRCLRSLLQIIGSSEFTPHDLLRIERHKFWKTHGTASASIVYCVA